jgi:uncharacterized membrane protein
LKNKYILLIIILTAAVIRVYGIEQKNLWFDELYSWHISEGSAKQIIIETSGDIHPPFYYIVLKYWIFLFSDSVISMRLLSGLFALLSMYFIYRIASEIFTENIQIYSVLLLFAFSPVNIFYSQEVRMLNLNLFLTLGSVYFFTKLIKGSSVKTAASYTIFTILALYTHYFSFLILFTEVLIFLFLYFRKSVSINKIKSYLICFVLIMLFYLPWFPVFFRQTLKGQPWRTEQTFAQAGLNVFEYIKEIFFSTYYTYENSAVSNFAAVSGILISLTVLYSLIRLFKLKISGEKSAEIFYINLFFFIPLLTAFLISLHQSILLSRYLSIIVPYFLMMMVYFSFTYFKKTTAGILVLFLLGVSISGVYINYINKFKNNDYRRIISYLEENFRKEDKLIVEPHYMGWIFDYYIKHNKTNLTSQKIFGWDLNMQIDSISKSKDLDNLCIITDYSSLNKDNYDSLPAVMNSIGYITQSSRTFYLIPAKVRVDFFTKNGIQNKQ